MAATEDPILPDPFLPGERVLDIAPRLSPRVGDPVPRRLNYVAGRSLGAEALTREQAGWDRKSALAARALNPGIVRGLEVEILGARGPAPSLRLTPGAGLTEDGLDLVVTRPMVARLSDLRAARGIAEDSVEPVGLVGLFLRPCRAQTASNADPTDPCPTDASAYAYADLVTQDAVELVWARLDAGAPPVLPTGEAGARPVRPEGGAPGDLAVLGPLSSTLVTLPADPVIGRTDPVDVPVSLHRSATAARIIAEEASARMRGARPAWADIGLPLAIAEVTEAGEVVFLDRFAIARQGGAVRRADPTRARAIDPTLRRARFDQFVDLLQALRSEGAAPAPASTHFAALPPVGVLPATLFDSRAMRCDFFPEDYVVEAAPIQLSQLEAVLAARAGLAPFDLGVRDYVQIMVPVPDAMFDPRLLIVEHIDPAFDAAIREAQMRAAQAEAALADLRCAGAAVLGAIDMATPEPAARPAPAAGGKAAAFAATARARAAKVHAQAAEVPLTEAQRTALSPEAFDAAVKALNAGKPAEGFTALKPLVEDLSALVDRANDHADMGFLRLQADIFRMRKQMGGEADATRLATSPVLANLATATTGIEFAKLFKGFSQEPPKPTTNLPLTTALASQPGLHIVTLAMKAAPDPLAEARSDASRSIAIKRLEIGAFSKAMTADFGKVVAPLPAAAPPETRDADTIIGKLDLSQYGLAGYKRDLSKSLVDARDVAWQGLVYGKSAPVRTTTVAERLRPSPAQEAKNGAVATKAEILRGIQALGLNLAGLKLPVSASRVTLIPVAARDDVANSLQGGDAAAKEAAKLLRDAEAVPVEGDFAVLSDKHLLTTCDLRFPRVTRGDQGTTPNPQNVAIYNALRRAAAKLYDTRLTLEEGDLPGLILADRLDPDPDDADEGAFYAAAVDALESAVSMLRLFEKRVQGYSAFLSSLRQALLDAIGLSEDWADACDAAQAEIDEARHDEAVASALTVEEQARLDALNARRRDILDKHVEIVAFGRPMVADRLTTAPGLPLLRPASEVLPAFLSHDVDLPDEIEEMVAAFTDAPLAWFPELAAGLKTLRRPEHFTAVWQRGLDRAQLWLARNADAVPLAKAPPAARRRVAGKAATGVYMALASALASRKAIIIRRTGRTMASLDGAGWSALHERAADELSIADLEAGGRAGRDLAARGTKMMAQIGSVAACFLGGLRKTPAALRLAWAEALSVHDDARDLSTLTAVPRWGAVPFAERRELEALHGWLFARIDRGNDDARAMMSLLVRICLLMASHAPVSALVEALSAEDKEVETGASFLVDVTAGAPEVGMIASFGGTKSRGRGVIEDIVGARARVRVTEVTGPPISVAGRVKIAFAAPVAVKMADLGG